LKQKRGRKKRAEKNGVMSVVCASEGCGLLEPADTLDDGSTKVGDLVARENERQARGNGLLD
jgi:hypothetical protein